MCLLTTSFVLFCNEKVLDVVSKILIRDFPNGFSRSYWQDIDEYGRFIGGYSISSINNIDDWIYSGIRICTNILIIFIPIMTWKFTNRFLENFNEPQNINLEYNEEN